MPISANSKLFVTDGERPILAYSNVCLGLVRFPNCHECPVASGLENLTSLGWADVLSAFSIQTTQRYCLQIQGLSVQVQKVQRVCTHYTILYHIRPQ